MSCLKRCRPLSSKPSCSIAARRAAENVAKALGEGLTERWLGTIGIVLYGVLFLSDPLASAERIVSNLDHLRDHFPSMIEEIRAELDSPTQQVRDILPGMSHSEETLRRFLTQVANLLEVELSHPPHDDGI